MLIKGVWEVPKPPTIFAISLFDLLMRFAAKLTPIRDAVKRVQSAEYGVQSRQEGDDVRGEMPLRAIFAPEIQRRCSYEDSRPASAPPSRSGLAKAGLPLRHWVRSYSLVVRIA